MSQKSELERFVNGIYAGIKIANSQLEDLNLKIKVPNKSYMKKKYLKKLETIKQKERKVKRENAT